MIRIALGMRPTVYCGGRHVYTVSRDTVRCVAQFVLLLVTGFSVAMKTYMCSPL